MKKQKIIVKEEPKYKVKLPARREEPPPPVRMEPKMFLESYYYGIYETGTDNDSGIAVKFEANVSAQTRSAIQIKSIRFTRIIFIGFMQ